MCNCNISQVNDQKVKLLSFFFQRNVKCSSLFDIRCVMYCLCQKKTFSVDCYSTVKPKSFKTILLHKQPIFIFQVKFSTFEFVEVQSVQPLLSDTLFFKRYVFTDQGQNHCVISQRRAVAQRPWRKSKYQNFFFEKLVLGCGCMQKVLNF